MGFVFSEAEKENRSKCQKCPLYQNKLVLGRGMVNADVLIIGEAPGKTECRSGICFTGRGGSLLNKELNRIGLWNYWITNVVKCCHFPKDFSLDLLQYCLPILGDELKGRK
jgi:uracil-DNA glycosylase family 4